MPRDTPYKGLVPYDEEDAEFFFGRDSQRDIIIANLMASRLTLVYGPSGVGKSSVLRAGVAHQLKKLSERDIEQRGAPEFAFVVFNSWRDNPIEALEAQINDRISKIAPAKPSISREPSKQLFTKSLAAWSDRIDGDIYVVLDQFEEYFLYHPREQGENCFAVQFPEAVNRPELRVNFLISIREDSLAKLDFFKGRIPRLFDNYLRIDHLDDKAARQAIEGPISKYNELYRRHDTPIEIDPLLTHAVLDQVAAGGLSLGETGLGVVESKASAKLVETPYLQLVMTRLWNEEVSSGSTELRLATLERLGNARTIVRTHLDETMFSLSPEEQETAASAFHYLVTPSGTKIAHKARDLAKYSGIPEREIEPVLEKLSTGKILILRKMVTPTETQSAPRYEIFHDVLATAILDWRSRFNLNRQFLRDATGSVQEKAAGRNRLKLLAGILALLAAVALAIYAYAKAKEAQRLRSLVFVKNASQNTGNFLGVFLAERAVNESVIPESEAALRNALREYPGLRHFQHLEGIAAADISPNSLLVVIAEPNGFVNLWDAETGKSIRGFHAGPKVTSVAFSHNSNSILTTAADHVSIWDTLTGDRKLTIAVQDLQGAEFSPDDQHLLTYSVFRDDRRSMIQILSISSGYPLAELVRVESLKMAHFNRAGDTVVFVTYAYDADAAQLWRWAPEPALPVKLSHESTVEMAEFSPDGSKVATAGRDGVRLFDAKTGSLLKLFQWTDDGADLMAFSEDGTVLASCRKNWVVVFEVSTGNQIASFRQHEEWINHLALSPDGSRLLTAGKDPIAKISYVSNQTETLTFPDHRKGVTLAKLSRNGEFVLTASGDKAHLWRAKKPKAGTAWEDRAPIRALLAIVEQRAGGRLPEDELDSYLRQ